ncbi:MAG: DUF3857 and transglutaminase domain-containing protein [bacterium]|nr:DUF3857 and transglutaminase domain-containing protein [bacterium]
MQLRTNLSAVWLCLLVCWTGPGTVSADESAEDKAVYEYKTWDCRIKGNKFTLTVKNRLRINNLRGDGYRRLSLFEDKYNKLTGVSARVLDADGKEIYRRKKEDMSRVCGYGNGALYRDACTYYTVLESAQYPYTIEYEYTRESSSLFFWSDADFQHFIPIHGASYRLTVPPGFDFHHQIRDLELEPEISRSGSEITYVWSASDIPALEEIDHLPPGHNEGARIEFVADRFSLNDYALERCDWGGIGRWYNQLAQGRYLSGNSLASGTGSLEAVDILYLDVQQRTRYVAVNIGIGGWQPHSADWTLEKGYGDCKDMSTLLVSKLRRQGIEAHPCLVLTRGRGVTDVDFPSIAFNHMVTMAVVGGDTLWLDCTNDNLSSGDVPWSIEDIDGLVVTEQGGQIKRISASTAEDNQCVLNTHLHIAGDRRLRLDVDLRVTGNQAVYLRGVLESMDNEETRKFVDRIFDGASKKYRIEAYEIRNLDELEEPVVIEMQATGIKPLRKIGATLYCGPFVLDEMDGFERTDLDDREFPLYLYYPELMQSNITITWDSSLAADSIVLPEDDSLSYPFGELRVDSRRSGDTVYVEFVKAYHAYELAVEQFADFEIFRERNRDIIRRYAKFMTLTDQ